MIEQLTWDSKFLGLKTARIQHSESTTTASLLTQAQKQGYKLIYAFANEMDFIDSTVLTDFNGQLVDQKVVFSRALNNNQTAICESVQAFNTQANSDELLELAYESGKYSRFKLDTKFKPDVFKRMYQLWIQNSINDEMADYVFVIRQENTTIGMVTLKLAGNTAQIGLIATAPNMQGKGLGRQLIQKCEQTALQGNCDTLQVPTQLHNHQAIAFYKACGFHIESITNIYHFWL